MAYYVSTNSGSGVMCGCDPCNITSDIIVTFTGLTPCPCAASTPFSRVFTVYGINDALVIPNVNPGAWATDTAATGSGDDMNSDCDEVTGSFSGNFEVNISCEDGVFTIAVDFFSLDSSVDGIVFLGSMAGIDGTAVNTYDCATPSQFTGGSATLALV